jgi:23S rRNA pseudouridine1911/1915/1917 synthase
LKKLFLQVKPGDQGERLDRFIASRGGIPRAEARRVLDRGGVWVDGKRVKIASRLMQAGQKVSVVLEEAGRQEAAPAALGRERILFEDKLVIAVDKPPFVAAQATLASDRGTLLALVSDHVGKEVGLVHRLDFETSGVTVFGKTRAASSALARAFREGTASKRYLALTCGAIPDEGRVDLPLSPDPTRQGRFVARQWGCLPAATRWKVLARVGTLSLLELLPETGRTHQIRVHLRALGAPIVGDDLYGGPVEVEMALGHLKADRVLLHARSLELPYPLGDRRLELKAPIPKDLRAALRMMQIDPESV